MIRRANLHVADSIVAFVEDEALPGSGIDAAAFWQGMSTIIEDLTPWNRRLLIRRDELQKQIDGYHRSAPGQPDAVEYRSFLERIGYLVSEPDTFTVTSTGVDDEITSQAGPQLVVPLLNARFAVNAANARWGSLYDALYGTDAIDEGPHTGRTEQFNTARAAAVIARGRQLLDQAAALSTGSHANATAYRVDHGALVVELADGTYTKLTDPHVFAGYTGSPSSPTAILLRHHSLHIEIVLDRAGAIGILDAAGIQDIVMESAITTIMDLEDSVAAVDAQDKALGYHNWHELMKGTLSEKVEKNGRKFVRTMRGARSFTSPAGTASSLPGRSLLLVRNVGHLMVTDAVRDASGEPIYEGILDAVMTALGALPDLRGNAGGGNSRTGSMYIVKPKMHGPEEVAFTVALFERVEQLLGLGHRTLKIGIMDEERRTTLNLRACIAEAADRVVFINTGFLDRTGDEIHTSLHAGVMVPKAQMRSQPFMQAYERANVGSALHSGFAGRAQIGKGMWAMPDLMHDMLEQKIDQVRAGATTAWVPSPTAATLHALHYHAVDASAVGAKLVEQPMESLDPILRIPLADGQLSSAVVADELDNNVQSILGYVVRWVDQGIGCSKVPDINGVALMEDRATLRISSQLLANWLMHGVISLSQLDDSLSRLSARVDEQNAGDPGYEPLTVTSEPGLAFHAARRLITEGASQPNGYTELILHEIRRAKKTDMARINN